MTLNEGADFLYCLGLMSKQ